MNLILLEPHELDGEGQATLKDRRSRHLQKVLRAESEDAFRAGVLGGAVGLVRVLEVQEDAIRIRFEAQEPPPQALPLKLVLALPRPKVLKRVLANVTTLGVKEIYLINAYRVEKPYWSSEHLSTEAIRNACQLGLEQARDTVMPRVILKKLFKPFVQDELPDLVLGTRALVAHPGAESPAPFGLSESITLAIGPEGGFIPYEVELLKSLGFQAIGLGPRILTFETAISFLAGRLF